MSTASWWAVATFRSKCTRTANSSNCLRTPAPYRPKGSGGAASERLAGDRRLDFQRAHRGQAPAAGVEHPLKLIAHGTEEVSRAFGVIGRGVRGRGVPLETRCESRAHQHGLAEGDAAQSCG